MPATVALIQADQIATNSEVSVIYAHIAGAALLHEGPPSSHDLYMQAALKYQTEAQRLDRRRSALPHSCLTRSAMASSETHDDTHNVTHPNRHVHSKAQ